MSDVPPSDPTKRFTGLADVYAKNRPDYPADAIEFVILQCGLGGDTLLVDVGCGTGISARLFASHGIPVVGVEPNDDMRARAGATPGVSYRKGTAEATGLADGCAAAVLAAQAFHWFNPPAALAEFHRILRPGGWVVLMWNERDERDACTAAYGEVMRTGPDAVKTECSRLTAGDPLLHSSLYVNAHKKLFYHTQTLDEAGLVGRAMSASYAPREPAAVEVFKARQREVFARFQREGRVVLCYETSVYLGQK
jgi:SAM-dependent methyltransferase